MSAPVDVPVSGWWVAEAIAALEAALPELPIEHRSRLSLVRVHLETALERAEQLPPATRTVACPRCCGRRYETVECADGTYETRCLLCDGHGVVTRQRAIALAVGLAQTTERSIDGSIERKDEETR